MVAYDGTDFCGWQKQEPPLPYVASSGGMTRAMEAGQAAGLEPGREGRAALRTVQAVLEKALREVVREPVVVLGASRTDAGVHARGQVAVFDSPAEARPSGSVLADPTNVHQANSPETRSTPQAGAESRSTRGWPESRGLDTLRRATNSRLPPDVLIRAVDLVPPGFNPIGDAESKGYSYTLHVSSDRPLWDRRYVHHVWTPLDLDRMNEAAAHLVGEHDFAAFAAAGHGRTTTVRTVHDCRVVRLAQDRLRIDISGSGFLWNMVRIIAGTLTDVGRGRIEPGSLPDIIASADRRRAGPTLPPTGLCLEWIRYRQAPAQ